MSPTPISGLHADMTCPECGSALYVLAQGRAMATEASVVLGCTTCPCQWHFMASLVRVSTRNEGRDKTRPPCGTDRGYQYHKRNGLAPCGECKRAHTVAESDRKKRRQQRIDIQEGVTA